MVAVFMQESSYVLAAVGPTKDYGIGQINIKTVSGFNLSKDRILTDVEYSVESSFKVMADFKRMYGKDPEYWTRYNSSDPEKRQQYKILVSRYM
jgi:hypothetical protein